MSNNQKGLIYALITLVLWGVLPIFIKLILTTAHPQTVVWFRFLVAFSILLVWNAIHSPQALRVMIHPPVTLVIAGLCLSANYFGFIQTVNYTTPSNAQLFMQMGPVLFALAGVIVFKEKLRKMQLLGFGIAVLGFVLFYYQQVNLRSYNNSQFNIGVAYAIGGFTTWVVYAVLQKKLLLRFSTSTLNLVIFGIGSLVYLPFVNFADFQQLDFWDWVLMICLGLNTLVAYGSLSQAFKYTEANKVSIILLMTPIITFVCMSVLGALNVDWMEKESFASLSFIGGLLVLLGAALVIKKARKKTADSSTD